MKYLSVLGLLPLAMLLGCGKAALTDTGATAKPTVEVSVATVRSGDIRSTLAVTGVLTPLPDQEAKLAPLAPGRIRQVYVRTGDLVHKGQAIATLDPGAATGQVQQAQAAVRVAESTWRQTRINYTSQTRTQSSSIEQARLNVQSQTVALAKLRAGSRPQEIAQAQSSVTSAQAALTNADQNFARSQTLFSQGLQARKDFEAAQAQQQSAKAALNSAEQALSLAKQGNRPEDIRAGELALAQAEQQLRATQGQGVQNASKAQDVQIAAGQLNVAKASLQSAIAQSKALTIVSPLAGTVVGRTVNAGESVDVTTVIATIVNLDRVRVLLGVPAEQVSRIAKGGLVEFVADINPGVMHTAVVSVISRAVDPASNTVQVEVIAANPGHTLRDDGFAKATLVTQVHEGVATVPAAALVEKDGKQTIYVAGQDGLAHAKEVTVGLRDGERVEIVSGVSVGDTIVTTGAFELDDGTKIKVSK